IELWRLPVPAELAGLPQVDRWEHQLSGGDDYELCFALSPERAVELKEWAEQADVELTVIGRITSGSDVQFLREDGGRFSPARRGFDHFPGVQA
ncbi:MAG TPA: thiamine-phosphate kinase, partial [Xanthomonadales bacterium]|nr:thiamine-phosphate kinase [Xanthomonadales bacterium]